MPSFSFLLASLSLLASFSVTVSNKDCSRFEGAGFCHDSNGNDYNHCAYRNLRLEECQHLTESTEYTVGFVYQPDENDESKSFCLVLLDDEFSGETGNTADLCPTDEDKLRLYGSTSHGRGRGVPHGSDSAKNVWGLLCYSCASELDFL